MKKITLLLACVVGAAFPTATAFASTSYDAGASNPTLVYVYGSYNWSQPGVWDLTTASAIPDTAVIDTMTEWWSLGSGYGMSYSSMVVGLFDPTGSGYQMDSGFATTGFQNQKAKQKWTTQYYVTNTLIGGRGYITPRLTLFWKDPVTGTLGLSSADAQGTSTKLLPLAMKESTAKKIALTDAKPYQPLAIN